MPDEHNQISHEAPLYGCFILAAIIVVMLGGAFWLICKVVH
jgi:hypothetical protein